MSLAKTWGKLAAKLHTHHDPMFVHKTCGLLALAHFSYRVFRLATAGESGFLSGDVGTLLGVAIHTALALSALIFHPPVRRPTLKPMIWKEFQLHSVIFSLRSCVAMLLLFVGQQQLRPIVILASHLAADEASRRYKPSATQDTIRGWAMPDWMSAEAKGRLQFFYCSSQLLALYGVMTGGLDEVFLILLAIQIAALCFTLVRKDLISVFEMHAIYAASLCGPFIYIFCFYPYWRLVESLAVGAVAGVLRFRLRLNKYLLWTPVALLHVFLLSPRVQENGLSLTRY